QSKSPAISAGLFLCANPPEGRISAIALGARMATSEAAARQVAVDNRFSFSAPIQRTRVGFAYRLGLLVSAIVLLVLPLVYLAMIAAVGWGVWLHIVNDVSIFKSARYVRGRAAIGVLVVYLAPIVIGAI